MNSLHPNNTHIEAGALVVNRSGNLLVLIGSDGLWSLPKGHIDADETPAQAAIREVCEETGIQSRAIRILRRFQFHRRAQMFDLTVFLAVSDGGIAFDAEHADTRAAWFTLEEVFSTPSYDSRYRDCVVDYLRYAEVNGDFWLHGKHDGYQQAIPREQKRLLEERLGLDVKLKPLNQGSKRPLFMVGDRPLTVRLMESAECAERSAFIARLTQAEGAPKTETSGRWIISEYVPGTSLLEIPNGEKRRTSTLAAGVALAAIHNAPLSDDEKARGFAEATDYIRKTTGSSLEALEHAGFISSLERAHAQDKLERWCYEDLAPQMIACTHWDYVPGNIIVAGERISVVDFESARLFFPAYDVVKALHYFEYFGFDARAFTSAYLQARRDSTMSEPGQMKLFFYMRCLAKRLGKPHLDHRPIEAAFKEMLHG